MPSLRGQFRGLEYVKRRAPHIPEMRPGGVKEEEEEEEEEKEKSGGFLSR